MLTFRFSNSAPEGHRLYFVSVNAVLKIYYRRSSGSAPSGLGFRKPLTWVHRNAKHFPGFAFQRSLMAAVDLDQGRNARG